MREDEKENPAMDTNNLKSVTWEAFRLIVKKVDKEQSYLMVHLKEPDDFLHVVAVETLQWSINFSFFMSR